MDIDNPFTIVMNRIDQLERTILDRLANNPEGQSKGRIGGMDLACEVLKGFYSKQTIYSLASAGKIPYSKRGKRLVFSETDLLEWLTRNKKKTKEEILKEQRNRL